MRKELEERYSDWSCVECKEPWSRWNGEYVSVREIDGTEIREPLCCGCLRADGEYSTNASRLEHIIEEDGVDSTRARIGIRSVAGRVERCSGRGRFPRVVLGMDIIEDCDRLHRATSYWRPFVNWFPIAASTSPAPAKPLDTQCRPHKTKTHPSIHARCTESQKFRASISSRPTVRTMACRLGPAYSSTTNHLVAVSNS